MQGLADMLAMQMLMRQNQELPGMRMFGGQQQPPQDPQGMPDDPFGLNRMMQPQLDPARQMMQGGGGGGGGMMGSIIKMLLMGG